jgi:phosphoglycerol transferase MdoB-like AlkP superfamily enzyme
MLQRIQSLFLLAVTMCVTILMFFPIANVIVKENVWQLSAFQFSDITGKNIGGFVPIGVIAILVGAIAVITILLFKNRGLQIKLCKLNLFLISLLLVACVFFTELMIDKDDPIFSGATIQYELAVGLPMIALIFNYLAIRFIKKDDKLVRSADRLR